MLRSWIFAADNLSLSEIERYRINYNPESRHLTSVFTCEDLGTKVPLITVLNKSSPNTDFQSSLKSNEYRNNYTPVTSKYF